MAGLVADYGGDNSSESDSESSSESNETDSVDNGNAQQSEKLPLPNILSDSLPASDEARSASENSCKSSVFFNPFQAKEDAKLAILEKHVKLSEREDESNAEDKAKFRKRKKAQRHNTNTIAEHDVNEGFKTVGKRRIGVTNSLIPPKKSLQAYERQRNNEKKKGYRT